MAKIINIDVMLAKRKMSDACLRRALASSAGCILNDGIASQE
jgi:hypothetical protein